MSRYRKRPVEVDALLYTGDWSAVCGWLLNWHGPDDGPSIAQQDSLFGHGPRLLIDTLEGQMACEVGDWLIRGVQGEFYPVKPDIFDAIYEPVRS